MFVIYSLSETKHQFYKSLYVLQQTYFINISSARLPYSSFSASVRDGKVSSLVNDLDAVANCRAVTLISAINKYIIYNKYNTQ